MGADVTTAYILGAGFSANAGVPVYNQMADVIFSDEGHTAVDVEISKVIRQFLEQAFAWSDDKPDLLPDLEDIFTMIDLSANSGHHLGREFSPRRLRALRRMLIHRTFRIINAELQTRTTAIDDFLKEVDPRSASFVVLNWDIVLEKKLYDLKCAVDYCCDCHDWTGDRGGSTRDQSVRVVKVHGSSNWVYCDNCRALFFDPHRKLPLHINAGLTVADFKAYGLALGEGALGYRNDRACRFCGTQVGPHIATFSMRKSFRTHAFAATWFSAEKILSEADEWLFIGYSFPQADYEFRHLLKSCELKQAEGRGRKQISAVFKGDDSAERRFRQFFGLTDQCVEQDGLTGLLRDHRDWI